MKKALLTIGSIFLSSVLLGCNATKGTNTQSPATTSMTAAAWTITTTQAGGGPTESYSATVVPNGTVVPATGGQETACNLAYATIEGVSVEGPACFTAIGPENPGVGSLSLAASDSGIAEPLWLVIGVPENPVPDGDSWNFVLIEALTGGSPVWDIQGTGTITNGQVTGSWSCLTAQTPACDGATGSFTATLQ